MRLVDQLQGARGIAGRGPRQEVSQLRLHSAHSSRGRASPGQTGLGQEVFTLEVGHVATVAMDGGQGVKTSATSEVKTHRGAVTCSDLASDGEDARVQPEAAEADTDRLAQQPRRHPAPLGHLLVHQGLQPRPHLRESGLPGSAHGSVQFNVAAMIKTLYVVVELCFTI